MRPNQKGCVNHIPFVISGGCGMVSDKPFLSISQQIEQLRDDRGLLFNSEERAHDILVRYGYYEVINGYKEHFMKNVDDDSKGFIEGITFEHVFALYDFDRHLREITMNSIELFEANLRQVVAYTVAENISFDQSIFMDRKHYRTGNKYWNQKLHKNVYPIDTLMSTMTNISKSKVDPYKHYREEHGNIPPWIIVKKLSFGNLIWWYQLLPAACSDIIIARMFGFPVAFVKNIPDLRSVFSSLLKLYLNYRNTAAHGGRIYNHKSEKYALPYFQIFQKDILGISEADYRHGKGQSRFGFMMRSIAFMGNHDPGRELYQAAMNQLKEYLKRYPDDKNYLLETMELTEDPIIKTRI